MDNNSLWKKVLDEISVNLDSMSFETWFNSIDFLDIKDNTIRLVVPIMFYKNHIDEHYKQLILDSFNKLLLNPVDNIVYILEKDLNNILEVEKDESKPVKVNDFNSYNNFNSNLKNNYTFDSFVVGESNKFAQAAALAVAENPGTMYNPLFIYGSSGLGKTHLMQAIGHYIIFNKPDLKVRYVRMEEYFNEWMKCFQLNDLPNGKKKQFRNNSLMRKFHQKFQNVDVLLMDDIQFIESKMKTMEDFFSTFEALYTNNKQIVIASDRLPKDIPTLDNRLRTRFEMGLVVDIVPPDYETRFEIVKAYAQELEVEADDDVFEYVAENFVNNVRELKGAFNKISAYAEFSGTGLTLDLAKRVLNCEAKKKEITVSTIAQKVADYFDLTVKDLKSTARQQKIAHARHVAVYLAREVLQMSYEAIGEFFSKKHTTIMYSCDLVADKLKTDEDLKISIEEIKASLRN